MITIENAQLEDVQVIADFQVLMARETENLELDPAIVLKGVSAVFEDPSKGFYLVARTDRSIIASLMITYEWSDWRARTVWWIQSLYVVPGNRRQGVFKLMYQNLLERIQDDQAIGGIRLYVDHTNVNAQKVYESLGMDGNHYRFFEYMK